MAGTILENLSGRKLTMLVASLLICQVICFLIGGLIGMFWLWLENFVSFELIHDCNFSTDTGQRSNHSGHCVQRYSRRIQ